MSSVPKQRSEFQDLHRVTIPERDLLPSPAARRATVLAGATVTALVTLFFSCSSGIASLGSGPAMAASPAECFF